MSQVGEQHATKAMWLEGLRPVGRTERPVVYKGEGSEGPSLDVGAQSWPRRFCSYSEVNGKPLKGLKQRNGIRFMCFQDLSGCRAVNKPERSRDRSRESTVIVQARGRECVRGRGWWREVTNSGETWEAISTELCDQLDLGRASG